MTAAVKIDVKQQETKIGSSILYLFTGVTSLKT